MGHMTQVDLSPKTTFEWAVRYGFTGAVVPQPGESVAEYLAQHLVDVGVIKTACTMRRVRTVYVDGGVFIGPWTLVHVFGQESDPEHPDRSGPVPGPVAEWGMRLDDGSVLEYDTEEQARSYAKTMVRPVQIVRRYAWHVVGEWEPVEIADGRP